MKKSLKKLGHTSLHPGSLKDKLGGRPPTAGALEAAAEGEDHEGKIGTPALVEAIFDYQATEAKELTFRKGDRFHLLFLDATGWAIGQLSNGTQGWFSIEFVQVLEEGVTMPAAVEEGGGSNNAPSIAIGKREKLPPSEASSESDGHKDETQAPPQQENAETVAATEVKPEDSGTVASVERSVKLHKSGKLLKKKKQLRTPTDYDSIENEVLICGWLNKKGRTRRNWKKRWFQLKGPHLTYFAKEGEKEPINSIHFDSCIVDELKLREGSARPCNLLITEGRKLYFYADDDDENIRWHLLFTCKSAELAYVKKMKVQSQPLNLNLVQFLHHPFVKKLYLDETSVSLEGMVALSQVVRHHKTLQVLSLKQTGLDKLGLDSLCDALKINQSLLYLDLSYNGIDAEGARSLQEALKQNTSIQGLSLTNNPLGEAGVQLLSECLDNHRQLEELRLKRTGMTDNAVKHLCEALSRPHVLPALHLDGNKIGVAGIRHIAKLLKCNQSITSLHLEKCGLDSAALALLAKAVGKSATVKELFLAGNSMDPSAIRPVILMAAEHKELRSVDIGYKLNSSNLELLRVLYACGLLATNNSSSS